MYYALYFRTRTQCCISTFNKQVTGVTNVFILVHYRIFALTPHMEPVERNNKTQVDASIAIDIVVLYFSFDKHRNLCYFIIFFGRYFPFFHKLSYMHLKYLKCAMTVHTIDVHLKPHISISP